jgi:hypothetical protein
MNTNTHESEVTDLTLRTFVSIGVYSWFKILLSRSPQWIPVARSTLGHGIIEKPYESALVVEFGLRAIPFRQQAIQPSPAASRLPLPG